MVNRVRNVRNGKKDVRCPRVLDRDVLPHPYKVPDGSLYLLGDNPPLANDSRIWGALPREEIISRRVAELTGAEHDLSF